ncbi:hypothetical protein E4U14_000842 [Claviceps sp. LM454 group G7]|nr:hypothetical protein E4U14_000842 [Claviceps sp. LM454 group G7]
MSDLIAEPRVVLVYFRSSGCGYPVFRGKSSATAFKLQCFLSRIDSKAKLCGRLAPSSPCLSWGSSEILLQNLNQMMTFGRFSHTSSTMPDSHAQVGLELVNFTSPQKTK